eukprot:1102978-Prymnesium_polylepis.1
MDAWMDRHRWDVMLRGAADGANGRRHRRRVESHQQEHGYSRSWRCDPARWTGACFNATKDVVAPPDFVMSSAQLQRSRRDARAVQRASCSSPSNQAEGTRPTLLFMSGARHSAAPWYSQGVRQELWRLHANASGVRGPIEPPKVHLAYMPSPRSAGKETGRSAICAAQHSAWHPL